MFMYFIYGIIVIAILVIIYGAWSRRNIYKLVDSLDRKKIDLMNTPVTEELSKIKGLRMLGETEERFDEWRSGWDEIVAIQLPNIEEKIFDIEELANKYRFTKAKRAAKLVGDELHKIEEHLSLMIQEVDQLVQSEEKNRAEINEVKEDFQDTKKRLWAQRSTISGASISLENILKDLDQEFEKFDEETDNGNYILARDILLNIQGQLKYMNEMMDKVPQFLVIIDKDIPKQIEELEAGMTEMEEEGFILDHFSFRWLLNDMKQRLITLIPLVENLKLTEVTEPIDKMEKEIEDIYEKLEHEAICKQKIDQALPEIEKRVEEIPRKFEQLRKEIDVVKLSYRLSEEEDRKLWKTEKQLKDVLGQLSVIVNIYEEKKQTFTFLDENIEKFLTEVEKLENEISEGQERLDILRRDEITADDTIKELKEKLKYGHKSLRKSNLPGVPETLLIELEEAEKALYMASEKLNELPLSIDEVMLKVEEAQEYVNKCVDRLIEVIENAQLAEGVIQYGNRYRKDYDELNIMLLQAEDHFRHYEYDEALELAVAAVKPVDSNVLERVSTNYSL